MQNDPRYYGGQGSHYAGYDGAASNYYDSGSYYPSSCNNPPSYAGGGGGGSFFDYDYNGYGAGATAPPSFGTNGVELQASDNCPNNFLIFDHTDNRSRIMYNPAFGQGYGNYQPSGGYQYPDPIPAPPPIAPPVQQHHVPVDDYRTAWRDDSRGKSSLKEDDSDDIDALLSLEDEDNDEEDDVVSTGRTPSCKYRCSNSPDSTCSTGGSKSASVSQKDYVEQGSSGGSSPVVPGKKKKKDRMKKMVKVLRGIVPGGQQMDTPAVLDEAVKYLKSLKVEARKLGFRS